MKVSELFETQINEGPLDYAKGVGQHFGDKIKTNLAAKGEQILKPFRDAHQAGQVRSAQADLSKAKEDFKNGIMTSIAQLGPIVKQIKDLRAQQPRNRQTNEGMWDYMRGAGKAAGQSAQRAGGVIGNAAQRGAQAVRSAGQAIPGAIQRGAQSAQQAGQTWHEEGQQTSIEGDIAKLRSKAKPLMSTLVQATRRLGPTGQSQIINAIKKYYEVQRQDRSTSMTLLIAYDKAMKAAGQSPTTPTTPTPAPQAAPTPVSGRRPARGSLPAGQQQGRINPRFA